MLEEIRTNSQHYFEDELGRKQGEYKAWYENGTLVCHCFYVNDELQGKYTDWYNSGQIWEETFFVKNKRHGEYKQWYENGKVYVHCFYVDDKRHGEYKEWHASGNGQVWEHCFFVNELAVSFKEIPYPTTPEDRLYFALKYNLLLLPVEKVC